MPSSLDQPISRDARSVIDAYLRAHPGVGEAPLFPQTTDRAEPVHKAHAGYWMRRAEMLAKLPKLERGAWHVWRRLWATERRHLSATGVAAAGGWRPLDVKRTSYMHADAATVYQVTALEPRYMDSEEG